MNNSELSSCACFESRFNVSRNSSAYYYGSKVKTVEIDCEDEDGAEFYMAGDFEPSLEWEKKGIAKFTAAEKKMMLRSSVNDKSKRHKNPGKYIPGLASDS